jgi:putative flippase GtrA
MILKGWFVELDYLATLSIMQQKFWSFIDLFYPLFQRLMPLQTFRYAVCGSLNTSLGLFAYVMSYQYLFRGHKIDIIYYAFEPHTAALFLSFCINLPLGFLLNKYVVFSESNIKGRIQLFRYFIFFIFCLFLNYVLLKLFVEMAGLHAILAQFITTAIVILVSYLSQKHFTFKVENKEEDFPF